MMKMNLFMIIFKQGNKGLLLLLFFMVAVAFTIAGTTNLATLLSKEMITDNPSSQLITCTFSIDIQ